MIKINIEKAKKIKKDYIRADRVELFNQLDLKVMKLLEQGDSVALSEVYSDKQALRDCTKEVDSIASIDALQAFQPEIIKKLKER